MIVTASAGGRSRRRRKAIPAYGQPEPDLTAQSQPPPPLPLGSVPAPQNATASDFFQTSYTVNLPEQQQASERDGDEGDEVDELKSIRHRALFVVNNEGKPIHTVNDAKPISIASHGETVGLVYDIVTVYECLPVNDDIFGIEKYISTRFEHRKTHRNTRPRDRPQDPAGSIKQQASLEQSPILPPEQLDEQTTGFPCKQPREQLLERSRETPSPKSPPGSIRRPSSHGSSPGDDARSRSRSPSAPSSPQQDSVPSDKIPDFEIQDPNEGRIRTVSVKSLQGRRRLDIHSPSVLHAVRNTVRYWPGVNLMSKCLELYEPYCLLVHYANELKAYGQRSGNGVGDSAEICEKERERYREAS